MTTTPGQKIHDMVDGAWYIVHEGGLPEFLEVTKTRIGVVFAVRYNQRSQQTRSTRNPNTIRKWIREFEENGTQWGAEGGE